MLRTLVVFLAVTTLALASLTIKKLEPKPDKYKDVEGCYIEDLDQVIPPGKSAPCHRHCMQYVCLKDYVQIATCGLASADPPCKIVEDHTKHYPDCCPKIECP